MSYDRLYYKYSHVGCPAAHMEDNCAHPDRCAENGRCLDLGPNPFDRQETPFTRQFKKDCKELHERLANSPADREGK